MMVTVRSLGLTGITGYEVSVECFLSGGLPGFDVVGLPDAAVKEARERVRAAIKSCWDANGYVIDPHTACGYHVFEKVAPAEGAKARVLLSTASPYKFPRACCDALGLDVPEDDFEAMRVLEQATNTVAPAQLAELESKPVLFEDVCDVNEMASYVESAAKRMSTN